MNGNKTRLGLFTAIPAAREKQKDRIFLNWVEHCSRSETLAGIFDTDLFFVRYLQSKGLLVTALRYCWALVHTTGLLLWRRPKLVFVMNQPVFLPMLVYCVSLVCRFQYVIDSHSGLFNKKKWIWAHPIMKLVCRRALFTIVTNAVHQQIVKNWGAKVEVLGTLLVPDHGAERKAIGHSKTLVVIGTFAEDEPTLEILRAASCCADVQFYMTGDFKRANQAIMKMRPENVRFTGFLERDEYITLVKSVDGAMILVTSDHTMQRGAYEAMSWGTPIITSDWSILRSAFPRGAVFVKNDCEDIARGVEGFFRKKEQLKLEMQELRQEKKRELDQRIREINTKLEQLV